MGFVSRHARTGEEKKGGGGRSFDRSDCTHSLTQLWSLNVVKKDRGAQNFRVLEYYAVLLLTTNYYESNPPDNEQNFHSSKPSHEQREYPKRRWAYTTRQRKVKVVPRVQRYNVTMYIYMYIYNSTKQLTPTGIYPS